MREHGLPTLFLRYVMFAGVTVGFFFFFNLYILLLLHSGLKGKFQIASGQFLLFKDIIGVVTKIIISTTIFAIISRIVIHLGFRPLSINRCG